MWGHLPFCSPFHCVFSPRDERTEPSDPSRKSFFNLFAVLTSSCNQGQKRTDWDRTGKIWSPIPVLPSFLHNLHPSVPSMIHGSDQINIFVAAVFSHLHFCPVSFSSPFRLIYHLLSPPFLAALSSSVLAQPGECQAFHSKVRTDKAWPQ